MDYEQTARQIADDALEYINRNNDQRFGAAHMAVKAIEQMAVAAIKSGETDNALAWQKELNDKIEAAV